MTGSSPPRPLAGRRVVITRLADRADPLASELRALGAHVVESPLIRIEHPRRAPALDAELRALSSYDWVVFTSVPAVEAVVRRLRALGRSVRALRSRRVAAVGPATALALRKRGIEVAVVAKTSTALGLAQALLRALPREATCLLHPASDRARGVLSERLASAGHLVRQVAAYRTRPARGSAARALRLWERADAVVVCSPSAVEQLAAPGRSASRGALTCIGPVTAKAARERGFRVAAVARSPTSRALASALVRALRKAG